ncbi:antimicrobial peptide, streptococcin A-M57 family protein [Enterococcus durans]|uniref:streptococcin A-M57 n=1 Tax=Enterococcus durans TaxID=53345 RepID=UPI000E048105|nr:streptococcin A-M57 [Enterococcus durans]MDB1684275.1 streptococcin A-M57 [Enterococcus durans]STP40085.1 antimicrobial peptide, streptococcin A-M57 family protein [Enterococcus durans]HCB27819.1 streptococcin A-M57 [Enterococcus sp.]
MELKVLKESKFFCLGMTLLMILGIFISTGSAIYADENVNEETRLEEQKKQAVEELKFYLEEEGHIDPTTKQYIPTDFVAIKAKSEIPGEEGLAGKFVFDNYVIPSMTRDLTKYATCIVVNSLPFGGVIWDALQGENAMQILINALASKDYDKAVDILLEKAKKTLSSSQLLEFNVATIAAGIAINAISCWGN